MTSVLSNTAARGDVTLKLPQLQNLCKRDPGGHRDDYDAQVRRLRSECGILALSPSSLPSPRLVELIQFVAAVSSSSYKGKESDNIAAMLLELLVGDAGSSKDNDKGSSFSVSSIGGKVVELHKDIRKACVSALILMRNKGAVEPLTLLHVFFKIMAVVPDKNLKRTLYHHIVNDVKNVNKKGKRNDKLNRSVQAFLHKVIVTTAKNNSNSNNNTSAVDDNSVNSDNIAARAAVDMVCDLYRRNVWTDDRTVAILESAIKSPITNVMTRAVRFFLNIEEKMEHDRVYQQEDMFTKCNTIDLHLHSRKTKKRTNQIKRKVENRAKLQRQKENDELLTNEAIIFTDDKGVQHAKKLYPAIELLHDPQGLAEHTLKRIKTSSSGSTVKFETKLLMINFVTRLVGNHQLVLLNLYPLLQRYMGGHQKDVTMILAYTVQACHDLVPPEEVHAILKTIAHNFVTERCSAEQMAVGINACRAVCTRVPSVLSGDNDEEQNVGSSSSTTMDVEAFARDLAGYAKHRDRSVSIAGRGWANFIREVHPSLLQGKDRGAVGAALHRAGEKPLRYGETKVASGVEGADLLLEYEAKREQWLLKKKAEGENDDEWESVGDGIEEVSMKKGPPSKDDEDEEEDDEDWVEVDEEEDDDTAPTLVEVKTDKDGNVLPTTTSDDDDTIDVKTMSVEERHQLQQTASSTRVFTAADFAKMKKLVAREEQVRRDPRAAAKRKRALAKNGMDFEELSDDGSGSDADSDFDSDDDDIKTHGMVNPTDIMAMSKKKRMNKMERLEKIVAGRDAFEQKKRPGGSTNAENKRKKNFVMTKFSFETRSKMADKETRRSATRKTQFKGSHESKKRRRKF